VFLKVFLFGLPFSGVTGKCVQLSKENTGEFIFLIEKIARNALG